MFRFDNHLLGVMTWFFHSFVTSYRPVSHSAVTVTASRSVSPELELWLWRQFQL